LVEPKSFSELFLPGLAVKAGSAFLIQDLDFSLERGERLALIGPSGSGKSTLLRTLAGEWPEYQGKIYWRSREIRELRSELVPGHPEITRLAQDFPLQGGLTVVDNLKRPLRSFSPGEMQQRLFELRELWGLGELWERRADSLSGGERQRVALAGNLLNARGLILLDEPFSQQDRNQKAALWDYLSRYHQEQSLIFISHDPVDFLHRADWVLCLNHGLKEQWGRPREVYRQPASALVASLGGPFLPASQWWGVAKPGGKEEFYRPDDWRVSRTQGQRVRILSFRETGVKPLAEVERLSDGLRWEVVAARAWKLGEVLPLSPKGK